MVTKMTRRPGGASPLRKISRSKIEDFMRCQRCFYLDRKLGVARPSSFPFNLNAAVDLLLKKEFDMHRAKGTAHPLMKTYGIKAIPFAHDNIDTWRQNFVGVQHQHEKTGLLVFGAVDDLWINTKGELHVVDYKATSKDSEVTLDAEWQDGYKRQMEIYQWLLRRNGFPVSDTGYFVYCNGRRDAKAFDGKLEFDVKIIPYTGDDAWVETVLEKIVHCLESGSIPEASQDCEYCSYRMKAARVTGNE
ncbi:MAG: PD-(D/E)XK nuclease family protein [Candidatus Komeilibacteria bacterium]|nr:PD-(D/E)XK nuclease family protein [Candidatus Komeilibacteria bacterium]